MKRSETRILTTHTGSLPRPDELRTAYVQRQAGLPIHPDELDRLARGAMIGVIRKQAEAQIDVGNDGEQTRENFFMHMMRRLTGFGGDGWDRPLWEDVERYPRYRAQREAESKAKSAVTARAKLPEAIDEIRYTSAEPIKRECATLRSLIEEAGTPFAETFVTAPSPGIIARAMRNKHYATERDYVAALGRCLRPEYESIVEAGFLLQIDAPDLALERHAAFKGQPLSKFLDFAEAVVDAINDALVNVPADRARMHVCWGNYEGPHDSDVDLESVLPTILRAKVGCYVLPFANGRHAMDFTALKKHPLRDDQMLVAGVIDTLTNVVEHPKVIADRIERIAGVVGDPKRLLAGTDCGFDTAAGSGRVADDVVWAKLASLSQGARLASEQLY